MAEPRLAVVIPTFNEGEWVTDCVRAVMMANETAGWDLEIIVVDDGSTESASVAALERLQTEFPGLVVLRQENQGRALARLVGLRSASSPHTLLLDARVQIGRDSLSLLRDRIVDGVDVWNLDVIPGSDDLPGLFWFGLTKIWWRAYFRSRTPVHFGVDDFDRFPKGTGAFLAPTGQLRAAMEVFDAALDHSGPVSDDTKLLRSLAAQTDIHLDPAIHCTYYDKPGYRRWVSKCYYRGGTFVDGYVRDARQARTGLALVAGLGALSAGVALRSPKIATGASGVGVGALAFWASRNGATRRESTAMVILGMPFALIFGAGAVRALLLKANAVAATSGAHETGSGSEEPS